MSGEYTAWAAQLRPGTRGSAGARRLLDDAPGELDELPGYFLGLSEQQLAACWVACIVSAAIEGRDGFRVADLNRVLLVVAERLNGVKLENTEDFQMSYQNSGKAIPMRASVVGAAGGGAAPRQPESTGLAPGGRTDAAGFQVVDLAAAPPSKKMRLVHPLLTALLQLEAGKALVVDPAKIDKALVRKIVTAAVKSGCSDANWYETADGRLVVGKMGGRKRVGGRKKKAPPSGDEHA